MEYEVSDLFDHLGESRSDYLNDVVERRSTCPTVVAVEPDVLTHGDGLRDIGDNAAAARAGH